MMTNWNRSFTFAAGLLRALLLTGFTIWGEAKLLAQGGRGGNNGALRSLQAVAVPRPTNLEQYVRNETALIALGKAFFWDMQAGSDGRTACATCHFHAGADHRAQNILASAAEAGPMLAMNKQVQAADFPFRVFSNPLNNRSGMVSERVQTAGSAGVLPRQFEGIVIGSAEDLGRDLSGSPFSHAGINVRQVTNRNSPSVINAVFNVRNFWDGRASNIFNGNNPFGDSDSASHLLAYRNGRVEQERLRMDNASLASQAVGPALNAVEMSYEGRSWPEFGRKLMALQPLGRQQVASDDSVLGAMANPDGNGLLPGFNYKALIHAAFQPAYWDAPEELQLTEANFAFYWGLAIQAYESTLVSDRSRFDRFMEGEIPALTALEQAGLREFQDGGSQCTQCHQGAEFSAASFTNVNRNGNNRSIAGNVGFFRIGVSPIAEDIGLGANDSFGRPLFDGQSAAAVSGLFKAPSLRNVELSGPYFHNGSQATLEQVIEFYARNGDLPNSANLGIGIGRINLGNAANRTALVAFLKSLTDERVLYEKAPFDHPSLCIPNGHEESASGQLLLNHSDLAFRLSAADKFALIPASGASGNRVPLQSFEELLRGIGNDGSRAHTLTQACQP